MRFALLTFLLLAVVQPVLGQQTPPAFRWDPTANRCRETASGQFVDAERCPDAPRATPGTVRSSVPVATPLTTGREVVERARALPAPQGNAAVDTPQAASRPASQPVRPPAQMPSPAGGHTIGAGGAPAAPAVTRLDSANVSGPVAVPTPPVRPPLGAQFVAWSSAPGAAYYPIACDAWFAHRSGLRWFMTELEARSAGLRPSTECLHAPRYDVVTALNAPPPVTEVPAARLPEPAPKPVAEIEPGPAKPLVWAYCEVLFATDGRTLLCRDGSSVILDAPARGKSPTQARDDLASRYPAGTRLYLEVLDRGNQTVRGRVIDKPADADLMPEAPASPQRRGTECRLLHDVWICS